MKTAFIDTSGLVSIAFNEPDAIEIARAMDSFDSLLASTLLEAELRAALKRENSNVVADILSGITWIHPDRPLSREITEVLKTGYLKGADAWHLAVALYSTDNPGDITFITLDERQREVAETLGFKV